MDAQLLAEYGKAIQPLLFVGKSEARNQLNAMLQAEKNRRRTQSASIRSSLENVIVCLETQLQQMDEEIQVLLPQHAALQTQEKLLRTAKSIGPVTAPRSWQIYPNWGNSIARKSRPWWVWRR